MPGFEAGAEAPPQPKKPKESPKEQVKSAEARLERAVFKILNPHESMIRGAKNELEAKQKVADAVKYLEKSLRENPVANELPAGYTKTYDCFTFVADDLAVTRWSVTVEKTSEGIKPFSFVSGTTPGLPEGHMPFGR